MLIKSQVKQYPLWPNISYCKQHYSSAYAHATLKDHLTYYIQTDSDQVIHHLFGWDQIRENKEEKEITKTQLIVFCLQRPRAAHNLWFDQKFFFCWAKEKVFFAYKVISPATGKNQLVIWVSWTQKMYGHADWCPWSPSEHAWQDHSVLDEHERNLSASHVCKFTLKHFSQPIRNHTQILGTLGHFRKRTIVWINIA